MNNLSKLGRVTLQNSGSLGMDIKICKVSTIARKHYEAGY